MRISAKIVKKRVLNQILSTTFFKIWISEHALSSEEDGLSAKFLKYENLGFAGLDES